MYNDQYFFIKNLQLTITLEINIHIYYNDEVTEAVVTKVLPQAINIAEFI